MNAILQVIVFGLLAGVWCALKPACLAATDKPNDLTWLLPPEVGESSLRVLTTTYLELRLITTQPEPPAPITAWDFVSVAGQCTPPPADSFNVTADGQPVAVIAIGFKRRVCSAALLKRDLRVENSLYLQLATPLSENQTVVVTQTSGQLGPANERFTVTNDPWRYSPAIHVNQEGYAPNFPKNARIGYYLGNLGELPTSDLPAFTICNQTTGEIVYRGTLTPSRDVGYNYFPQPYQQVLQADFSQLTASGDYSLLVPGLGASLPFRVDAGVPMNWLRTYALGIYHQRCGEALTLPYTRFTHAACHLAPASIPSPQADFLPTWASIAAKSTPSPHQTAPALVDESTLLYPFVNQGKIDVSGGHHDAGDYSKYTIDVAALIHTLIFTADAFPAAGALDNLGLPESGDGIGDLLQEAKIEADFLAKLQDADGGFYFLVYPQLRHYEGNVSLEDGDTGDAQVVWPKNTAASAAAVAALAQCASSPAFKRHYPETAAAFLQKAELGWSFLMHAIAAHGLAGAYQKITFYGDEFSHLDELTWAATELYLATGDNAYQNQLFEWFPNPTSPATRRWGWQHLSCAYGNAIRSYVFASRTGRLTDEKLDRSHLAQCRTELAAAADDALHWTHQHAYGSAFPAPMKRFRAAGWYFSLDRAADLAVAYQLWPRTEYFDALVSNLNYEGGTNPLNLSFVAGLGRKRPQVIVNQFANNDRRALPPTGLPLGNIQAGFPWLARYEREPGALTFPADDAPLAPYPFYDRWADLWNTSAEFTTLNQARSILALAALLPSANTPSRPWKSSTARIHLSPNSITVGQPVTLTAEADNLDLAQARIIWEGRDQTPTCGPSFRYTPQNPGPQWAEMEAAWPDGRRVFANAAFTSEAATPTPPLKPASAPSQSHPD